MESFGQKINCLNNILGSPNFYPFLCAYSNNEIDTVIDNLSKLINYVLTVDEDISSLDIKTLLKNAMSYKKQGDFLIYGTNSYLDNSIKLFGLNPDLAYKGINRELTKLDLNISFLDDSSYDYFPLYGTVKQAIEKGFTHPKSLYQGILKQPSTDTRPLMVGETETEYYSSVLQRRLKNIPNDFGKTGAKIAKKILKEIIGKGVTLYFIPPDKFEKKKK